MTGPLMRGILHKVQACWIILCSVIPLTAIICHQPFVVLGIAGLPNSWWDVLTLDFGLVRLLKEFKLTSFIAVFGTPLACVRPTMPGASPGWLRHFFPLWAWFFFSDASSLNVDRNAAESSEVFMYINGICNTRRMSLDAGAALSDMLNKNVSVVHNPTDSMLVDLLECVIEKAWTGKCWATIEPCKLALNEIKCALLDERKTKVVLISHSQGTIIASDVLSHLWDAVENKQITEAAMQKLEMYCFANAAHTMKQKGGFPYIESICNQQDNVGMLGANAPKGVQKLWKISIAGELIKPYTTRWGHMLSAHYLKHLKAGDYGASKLHHYMKMAGDTSGSKVHDYVRVAGDTPGFKLHENVRVDTPENATG